MSTIMTRHMTVDEFERLEESLGDERVELINGCVIGRGDMEPAHVLATGLVKQGVEPMLPGGWFMRKDEPVRIPDFNEPFPDLAVVHGDLRTHAIRHPGPGDVALVDRWRGGRTPRGVGDLWLNIAAKVCYSGSVGLIDPRTTSQPSRGRR